VVVRREFVALAPDLYDGAGVVLCNPERACLLAEHPDDGTHGLTAAQTASQISRSGVHNVTVLAGPRDQRGARILHDACLAVGLDAHVEVVLPAPLPANKLLLTVPELRTDAWFQLCRDTCREHGSENVRIAPRPLTAVPPCPGRRSPLPVDLHLEEPEWRAAFLDLVAECWPRNLAPFLAAVGAADLGSNPLEDVYAGLGLREHNAELLANIVDRP
jgi:hypothetical protein